MKKLLLTGIILIFTILPVYAMTADEYAKQAVSKVNDKKDYKGAVADYASAIKLNPKVADYYLQKAMIELLNLHDYKQAHKDIETAIALDPQNSEYKQFRVLTQEGIAHPKALDWMLKAKEAMDNENYPESLIAINKAIELNPNFALYYGVRGHARSSNEEDPALALADYDKAMSLDKENIMGQIIIIERNQILHGWNEAVGDKISSKDYTGALLDINKLIDIAPDYAESYSTRGIVYMYLKQYNNAISELDTAIALDPQPSYKGYRAGLGEAKGHPDAYSYYKTAQEKLYAGDFAGGVTDTTNAIKLSPDFGDYYVIRAVAKNKLKDYKGALADMEKAIAIDPDNKTKFYNRDGLLTNIKKNIAK